MKKPVMVKHKKGDGEDVSIDQPAPSKLGSSRLPTNAGMIKPPESKLSDEFAKTPFQLRKRKEGDGDKPPSGRGEGSTLGGLPKPPEQQPGNLPIKKFTRPPVFKSNTKSEKFSVYSSLNFLSQE